MFTWTIRDLVFCWNGTTSGVCVPPAAEWISDEREGLTICDATSAIFGVKMAPWHKLDVVTFSWQKVLGGEGAHGILILSPRAVERLESWSPEFRPIPKIFRLTSGSPPKLIEGIFRGETINTPSMLCVEDYLDALEWVEDLGGIDAAIAKTAANYEIVEDFVKRTPWAHFLCENPKHRSKTSVCLTLDAPAEAVKRMQVSDRPCVRGPCVPARSCYAVVCVTNVCLHVAAL